MKPKKPNEKITNEKPVSLEPLEFEEAIRDLLKIPPAKESKEHKRTKRRKAKA